MSALELFANLLAVLGTVDVDTLVIFRRFAYNLSIDFDFHFIPFHGIYSGHIVCPISDMRYIIKNISVIR